MRRLHANDDGIAAAAALLLDGERVAIPTETVYGLAAVATDERAVAGIFEAKGRPRFDPLIVHLPDAAAVWPWVADVPRVAYRLAEAFWPGPLTLVLPRRSGRLPDLVTSGLPTVAVRVPDHPVTRALLRAVGKPVAAPSANRFGRVSPTTAEHVLAEFPAVGSGIAAVLDAGPCTTGIESTIVAFDAAHRAHLLRPGGVAIEAIEAVLVQSVELRTHSGAQPPTAPGMLASHYAPATPLTLVPDLDAARRLRSTPRPGLLTLTPSDLPAFAHRVHLSPTGDLPEAAARLFAAMRELDALDVDEIVAVALPEAGLGRAINDRLRRASHR